jgi:hypothetical protein
MDKTYTPFKFQIVEALDVNPAFEQGAHHLTILIGNLLEGALKIGQMVFVPIKNGKRVPAFIMNLASMHRIVEEITSPCDDVEVVLRGSSVRFDEVEAGIAEWCEVEQLPDWAERLRSHPSLLLHNTCCWEMCELCFQILARIPDCEAILKDLDFQNDPKTGKLAQQALARLNSRREESERRARWLWVRHPVEFLERKMKRVAGK